MILLFIDFKGSELKAFIDQRLSFFVDSIGTRRIAARAGIEDGDGTAILKPDAKDRRRKAIFPDPYNS
jgi:hypothetical protein